MLVLLGLALLGCNGDKDDDTGPGGSSGSAATPTGGGGTGGGTGGGSGGATPETPFDSRVAEIRIEIDYATGAEPYTSSSAPGGSDLFTLFEANAAALFPDTPVRVPHTLDRMEELTDLTGDAFTVEAILDIADAHWADAGDAASVGYYVVWLDGEYDDGTGPQDGVLGVSIGTTRVIAMFKPVIASVGLLASTREFGEQAVLVHEFGHAIGLVDNGVDMVTDHKDAAHGAHCDVEDCIMYWSLESRSALADFVLERITGGEQVLFGPACLADVAAAR